MRYIGIDLGTSAAKLLLVASERGPGMGGAMLACEEYGTVADACKALVHVSDTVHPDPAPARSMKYNTGSSGKSIPPARRSLPSWRKRRSL